MEEIWKTIVMMMAQAPQEAFWAAEGLLCVFLVLLALIRWGRRRKTRRMEGVDQIQAPVDMEPAAGPVDKAWESPESLSGSRKEETTGFSPPAVAAMDAAAPAGAVQIPAQMATKGFLGRLKSGLSKTRNTISGGLDRIFSGSRKLDQAALEEVEELLITADVGVQATMGLIQKVSQRSGEIQGLGDLKAVLKDEILASIQAVSPSVADQNKNLKPRIIMIVGVNGVGKTTTIGKLAARFVQEGKRVLIVAADTFRAAAIEQLTIWAERAGTEIVKHKQNADPAAVAYDGVEAAVARGMDVVLIDTAGRLHTKVNLMEELKKIKRTIAKKIPEAPHEILLVLDATTGQNALTQAKMFHESLDITGIALTKLDGTAKGGIVIAICSALNLPLSYIGVGEQTEDLQNFDPQNFVNALFEEV